MEEKKSIKKIAFLLIIIANIILLLAVIFSVSKAVKNLEIGAISTPNDAEDFNITDTQDSNNNSTLENQPSIVNNENDLEGQDSSGLKEKLKSITGSLNFNVSQLVEIGLFLMGILLFFVGVFLLRAVKRLN